MLNNTSKFPPSSPVYSNTGVINTLNKSINCISKGIDNIYLTVAIDVKFYNSIIEKIGDSEIVEIFDYKFNVGKPGNGSGGYGILIYNKYLRIMLTNNFIQEMPNMKIIINSVYLHTEEYLKIMEYIIKNFGDYKIKTNRIDIYGDFQGLKFDKDIKTNRSNIICKSNKFNIYGNSKVTGITYGSRRNKSIYLRI